MADRRKLTRTLHIFTIAILVFIVFYNVESTTFSVPTEVIDVTTFYQCSDVDVSIQDIVCLSNNTKSITAIRLNIIPGQNDLNGGRELDFFAFPQALASNPVNTATSGDNQQCFNADPSANCSTFVTSSGAAGPIRVFVSSGNLVSRYNLNTLGVQTPYAYLDHNSASLNCGDKPKGDGEGGDGQSCSRTSAPSTGWDTRILLNPWLYNVDGQSIGQDATYACRGKNNNRLGQLYRYGNSAQSDFIPGTCFACPLHIDQQYKGSTGFGDTFSNYYTTVSTLCPNPQAHTSQGPATKYGAYSQTGGNTDLNALEPYWYWCLLNDVGYESDDITRYMQQQPDVGEDAQGTFYDLWTEFAEAYGCSIQTGASGQCKQLTNAGYMDREGKVCCKCSVDSNGHCINDDCSKSGNAQNCSGLVTNQVLTAMNYITASCNADDSGENFCPRCNIDNNYEWRCPGDPYQHIRPKRIEEPFYAARCSAGCSAVPTVTMTTRDPSDNLYKYKDEVVEAIIKQKAAIELGGPQCDVYSVDPRPHAIVNITVTIVSPDNNVLVQKLGTNQRTFVSGTLDGVKFSTRINRIQLATGSTGRDITGLIVICGTRNGDATTTAENSCNGAFNDPEFNLVPPSSGQCNVPLGTLRGIFPDIDSSGQEIPGDPTVNPWPQLIAKMYKDRTAYCNANVGSTDYSYDASMCTEDALLGEFQGCAVPIPKYLGVLNCGRPTYWYYVNEINMQNYGGSCGQLGFRNSYVSGSGGAQFVCQQGENSCTPGFGAPRYGTAGTGFIQSPCQEFGRLVNYSYITSNAEKSDNKFCTFGGRTLPENLPPGIFYSDYPNGVQVNDNPTGGTQVPNMWVDGPFLYRLPAENEQALMSMDIEIYTDTTFGGSVATFTPGNLSWTNGGNSSTNYCSGALNKESSGEITVLACNTNTQYNGNYRINMECSSSSTAIVTLDPGPDILKDIGANTCEPATFQFTATGSLDLSSTTCISTLYHGGGDNAILDRIQIECQLTVAEVIAVNRQSYLGPLKQPCKGWDLFCLLSQGNAFEKWVFYIWLGIVYIMIIALSIAVLYYIYYAKQAMEAEKKITLTSVQTVTERQRETLARQEKEIQNIVQQTINQQRNQRISEE